MRERGVPVPGTGGRGFIRMRCPGCDYCSPHARNELREAIADADMESELLLIETDPTPEEIASEEEWNAIESALYPSDEEEDWERWNALQQGYLDPEWAYDEDRW